MMQGVDMSLDVLGVSPNEITLVIATSGSFQSTGIGLSKVFGGKFGRRPYIMYRPRVRATPWSRKHDSQLLLNEIRGQLKAMPHKKMVLLAYSETAVTVAEMVDSGVLDEFADNLTVVLMANANRANGGFRARFGRVTGTRCDGMVRVIDIANEYEGLADSPLHWRNFWAMLNAYVGYLISHSNLMRRVDFDEVVRRYGMTVGTTTYVNVPHPSGLVPLVRLLLRFRFVPFDNRKRVNTWLKKRIDSGYDRTRYGEDLKFR